MSKGSRAPARQCIKAKAAKLDMQAYRGRPRKGQTMADFYRVLRREYDRIGAAPPWITMPALELYEGNSLMPKERKE